MNISIQFPYYFSKFFFDSRCIIKEARILSFRQTFKLNIAFYMHNTLKQEKHPALRPFLWFSCPCDIYPTRISNQSLIPIPLVEAIRINFKVQYVNVWPEIPYSSSGNSISSFFWVLFLNPNQRYADVHLYETQFHSILLLSYLLFKFGIQMVEIYMHTFAIVFLNVYWWE